MRTTGSQHCLTYGLVASLKELTARPAKRKLDPSRPPLPKVPKVRDKTKRDAEKRRLRKQIRKLFPKGAWKQWNSNATIAKELDVPYNDVLCLMADRSLGTPALERIAAAVLKRHAKETT